jgi:choline dehydrogenase-like flavoprotein
VAPAAAPWPALLAPTGLKILVLERGDWLPQEPQNWDAEEVFQKNRYVSKDTWFDKHGKPFQPGSHYFVGGATKMYGAAHFRLRQQDFEELVHHRRPLAGLAAALQRFRALVSAGRGDVSRAWPAR